MCDASEHAAGYNLLTEDYTETAMGHLKPYAASTFWSRRFKITQPSLTMYADEILAKHFAFVEFGLILWGVKTTRL